MKKIFTLLRFSILPAILFIFIVLSSGFKDTENTNNGTYRKETKNPLSELIAEKRKSSEFKKVDLFEYLDAGDRDISLSSFVKNPVLLKLNNGSLKQILQAGEPSIELTIPVSNSQSYTLQLTMASVFSDKSAVISKSSHDEKLYPTEKGIHYRGILKEDDKSWAAISIFQDFVMALIATENGNYVLGSIKNSSKEYTDNYIFYNDRNLLQKPNFKCYDGDNEDRFVRNYKPVQQGRGNVVDYSSVDTVGIYFEADYQMYLDNNSNYTHLVNFISGVFNQVATIYQNDLLPVKISNIGFWSHQDPYANDTDAAVILQRFGYNQEDNFSGDLAHLLSTGHNQRLGGIAWINVLCTPYNSTDYSGRFAFSNIENTYTPYPTYSWTVTVVAHETGHNFGSYHTHACHWHIPQGGIGALDSCYYAEGNCFPFPEPNYNGSLMSYCHLNGAINLANGFGRPFNSYWSQPGDTVRIWYQRATCLHYETNSSELPHTYDLLQNYPNPFNPVTNIKYSLPEDAFVTLVLYDITGREVARLVDGKFFNAGIYSQTVDANALNMASGVYLYKLSVNRGSKNVYSEIRKMVLIK